MRKIVLIGNPNVGKSTVFNALTGMKQHTGNWTGKTVNSTVGEYQYNNYKYQIYDLPGTYSLIPTSFEEEVVRDFVYSGDYDVIVIVCDAVCLERNLNLVLQIKEVTDNLVVCVNLMDEAKKKKIIIDLDKLSKELNVRVVGTSARSKTGLGELKEVIEDIYNNKDSVDINKIDFSEDKVELNFMEAERISNKVITYEKKDYHYKDRVIDKILTSRLTGIPVMIILVLIIFWITIRGANYPSMLLFRLFEFLEGYLTMFFNYFNAPDWLYGVLVLGVYRVVTSVISVMLPPMAIFFPLFTLLEDVGYLPRIAFNLDRCFQRCKTCGKQALTMCMGFGCNAVAVVGSKIIDSPRERLIAIITNSFIPCNGKFPTIIALISIFFVGSGFGSLLMLTGIIIFSVLLTFLVSKLLSLTILKGTSSSFVLELPPYRKPQIIKVIIRSIFDRTLVVLGRALVIAAPAGLIIWLLSNIHLNNISLLTSFANFLDPAAKLIGLDGMILAAFILGFPANEIVIPIMIMGYIKMGSIGDFNSLLDLREILINNGWTWLTALCVMLFSLAHWPCSTTCLTIKKETQSIKWAVVSFLVPTITGITLCFLVNNIVQLLGLI
ncbi:MAG: ferrous iron transporter B [Bacilli bacterium]|nr:ferrous iron transporter B [Bacilli bacterium]MDD4808679.1 ferrous iron transporter B [Bacilli bacterium]